MKTPKKVVQTLMSITGGCGSQISKKQDYVLNPMNVLRKRGFTPEIWTTHKQKIDSYEGVKIRRFSNTLSLLLHLFFDRNVKLVYAQLRSYLPSLISPLSGKKCILMTQTYELGSNSLIRRFSLFFMRRFTRIFVLTPYEREVYIKEGLDKEKVVFSPHAIDYSFFSKKPKKDLNKVRKKYGISENDFVIATVANFRKFKNLDIIVGAFALFHKKVKNSKMIVVGKDQTKNPNYREQGNKRYNLVEDVGSVVKRENLEKDVIFTGGLGYEDVRDVLYISDLFVNVSDPEGMGMAVYEAASVGVPLCLSNIGSFTSVFKGMALFSSPRSVKALTENYLKYHSNRALREKHSMVLKEYVEKWDYPYARKKFEKIFSEILD